MTTERTRPPEPLADADWLPPGGWRQANDWARAVHVFYPPIAVYRAMLDRINQSATSIQ